ncbi:MAG: nuclease A inhibitor family protein [Pyrinomonadaceae bacterium]
MLSDDQLLAELIRATDGLLFMSESDHPFTPVRWSGATELTPATIRHLTGHDEAAPVETRSVDDLFRVAAAEPAWKSAPALETARRYQQLLRLLNEQLTDLRVYRIGRVSLDVYIIGRSAAGNWLGLRTHIIET